MNSPRRRLLAVLLLGVVPWIAVPAARGTSLVFSFGLVQTDPFSLIHLYDYLVVHTAGLPRRLEAWPIGVLLYAGALACAVGSLWEVEDPRLTGGLLLLTGAAQARVAWGLHRTYGEGGPIVVPIGVLATVAVLWWFYWPLVRDRGLVGGADRVE